MTDADLASPALHASPRPALRVIARSELLPLPIRAEAERALGFPVAFEMIDDDSALRRVIGAPDSFDVYHQWHTVDLIWTGAAMQPIDISRIAQGEAISALARRQTGSVGLAPIFRKVFLQPDGHLGPAPTSQLAILPIVHGADCFAYRPQLREILGPDERESWGWLLDPRLHGQVAMLSDPVLGMLEAALATEAHLGVAFEDIGNLSIEDIDLIADGLIQRKKLGHFRAIWENYEESARLMRRGGVLAQSMFGPGAALLRRQGVPLRIADAIEGTRGWHVDLCISRETSGEMLEASYAYLNWWSGGWPTACLSRQGYYAILPEQARRHLSPAEWDYWYRGLPAATELTDPLGQVAVAQGDLREGGSYAERMSRVRVWNTYMDEHAYLIRRWREFLAA